MQLNLRAVTVKQLNTYVKSMLDGDAHLQGACVVGEISNFKRHYASGHLYFTLKDESAAIRCVMFRSYAEGLSFAPCDGMRVALTGRVSIYEKDGQYQLYADRMFAAGAGDLALKFEQLKEKLEKEGIFDSSRKRAIPKHPKKIAVVTSETGAAVKDILNILDRRWSLAQVIMCPVSVQGENAVPEMLDALDRLYKFNDIDVIIIGRGGGSAEDLWQFNDERLARKVYASPVPVISAVGHETDFTLCDFAADLRAPTPSAAAELAVPDAQELNAAVLKYCKLLKAALKNKYEACASRYDRVADSAVLSRPHEALIQPLFERTDRASDRLVGSYGSVVGERTSDFSYLAAKLDALSPMKTIARGYAVLNKNGKTVRNAAELCVGDTVDIKLSDGSAECVVEKIKKA